ncbi:MAG: hypothetical protein K2H36_00200 [Clostridia bacterium]|nr:hypothetical protein [Clostridia bacterium]
MEILLNGKWNFKMIGTEKVYDGVVPGDVMTDLLANNVIPDPLIGLNESLVQWVGRADWDYFRTFEVDGSALDFEFIELDFEMLDTLADVYVNEKKVASVKNINRHYAFDVKQLLKEGENSIRIRFYSPLLYIANKQKEIRLPNSTLGEAGSCHIRKSPYHFGWDWGPHMLTCGISGNCSIKCYNVCKITRVDILQTHAEGKVTLDLNTHFSTSQENLSALYTLCLNGKEICKTQGAPKARLTVEKPALWWCNNMGEQNLYDLKISVYSSDGNLVCEKSQKIGLRTIVLDTQEDKIGKNFCFYINGKRIFARGANWIPADSFINRVSDEKLYDLLYKAKACNMNMIRVWGGGYYESDRFYDICDRLGLLVWQDCNFACSPYPFNDKEFVDEVLAEISDNVLRLKNRACLCLWAGNNEIESMSMAWLNRRDVIKYCGEFFYDTLKKHIASLDENTAYWACTPSSGTYMKNINSPDKGDTHLWHVWHGLRKLEHYRKMNTRFCSEFGIESLPSLNAIEEFSDGHAYDSVNAPLAKAHQKCIGGNGKIKYYMLSKFWTPKRFEDTVYLSQLTQAICVKNATEGWRVKKGRCNGALYWQYNDCWGVNSWSGMDYYGNMKALQYMARRFNQNTALSIQLNDKIADVFFINDHLTPYKAKIICGIRAYTGEILHSVTNTLTINDDAVGKVVSFDIKTLLKKRKAKDCYLFAIAYDMNGNIISEETLPLTNENKARLPKTKLSYTVEQSGNMAKVTITADNYARFVELRLKGFSTMLSDNYFDMLPMQKKTVVFEIPKGKTIDDISQLLSVRSLVDVPRKYSSTRDRLTKLAIFLNPVNIANYIARTFDK